MVQAPPELAPAEAALLRFPTFPHCSPAAPLSPLLSLLQVLLSTEKLATTPFLILGNKIDMPSAVPEMELRRQLGITATTGKETKSVPKDVRPVELFMCSILRKTGYKEGFDWLTNFL